MASTPNTVRPTLPHLDPRHIDHNRTHRTLPGFVQSHVLRSREDGVSAALTVYKSIQSPAHASRTATPLLSASPLPRRPAFLQPLIPPKVTPEVVHEIPPEILPEIPFGSSQLLIDIIDSDSVPEPVARSGTLDSRDLTPHASPLLVRSLTVDITRSRVRFATPELPAYIIPPPVRKYPTELFFSDIVSSPAGSGTPAPSVPSVPRLCLPVKLYDYDKDPDDLLTERMPPTTRPTSP
ncbi:MAG: hypothetical protein KBD64_00265 [Gammaproteobacteria bacterium]|nr:hypothetical protein [Gammaproteobacteria bacterium]